MEESKLTLEQEHELELEALTWRIGEYMYPEAGVFHLSERRIEEGNQMKDMLTEHSITEVNSMLQKAIKQTTLKEQSWGAISSLLEEKNDRETLRLVAQKHIVEVRLILQLLHAIAAQWTESSVLPSSLAEIYDELGVPRPRCVRSPGQRGYRGQRIANNGKLCSKRSSTPDEWFPEAKHDTVQGPLEWMLKHRPPKQKNPSDSQISRMKTTRTLLPSEEAIKKQIEEAKLANEIRVFMKPPAGGMYNRAHRKRLGEQLLADMVDGEDLEDIWFNLMATENSTRRGEEEWESVWHALSGDSQAQSTLMSLFRGNSPSESDRDQLVASLGLLWQPGMVVPAGLAEIFQPPPRPMDQDPDIVSEEENPLEQLFEIEEDVQMLSDPEDIILAYLDGSPEITFDELDVLKRDYPHIANRDESFLLRRRIPSTRYQPPTREWQFWTISRVALEAAYEFDAMLAKDMEGPLSRIPGLWTVLCSGGGSKVMEVLHITDNQLKYPKLALAAYVPLNIQQSSPITNALNNFLDSRGPFAVYYPGYAQKQLLQFQPRDQQSVIKEFAAPPRQEMRVVYLNLFPPTDIDVPFNPTDMTVSEAIRDIGNNIDRVLAPPLPENTTNTMEVSVDYSGRVGKIQFAMETVNRQDIRTPVFEPLILVSEHETDQSIDILPNKVRVSYYALERLVHLLYQRFLHILSTNKDKAVYSRTYSVETRTFMIPLLPRTLGSTFGALHSAERSSFIRFNKPTNGKVLIKDVALKLAQLATLFLHSYMYSEFVHFLYVTEPDRAKYGLEGRFVMFIERLVLVSTPSIALRGSIDDEGINNRFRAVFARSPEQGIALLDNLQNLKVLPMNTDKRCFWIAMAYANASFSTVSRMDTLRSMQRKWRNAFPDRVLEVTSSEVVQATEFLMNNEIFYDTILTVPVRFIFHYVSLTALDEDMQHRYYQKIVYEHPGQGLNNNLPFTTFQYLLTDEHIAILEEKEGYVTKFAEDVYVGREIVASTWKRKFPGLTPDYDLEDPDTRVLIEAAIDTSMQHVACYDYETLNETKGVSGIVRPFLVTVKVGASEVEAYEGIDCTQQLLMHLLRTCSGGETYFLVAHNGSKFDHYFMLMEILRGTPPPGVEYRLFDNSLITRNGRILGASFSVSNNNKKVNFVLRDTFIYWKDSLSGAGEAFGCETKKKAFPYEMVKSVEQFATCSFHEEMIVYAKADTQLLSEIVHHIFKLYSHLIPCLPFDFLSTTSITKAIYFNEWYAKEVSDGNALWANSLQEDIQMREFYQGGNVQSFYQGMVTFGLTNVEQTLNLPRMHNVTKLVDGEDEIIHRDVTSEYPTVMKEGGFPVGQREIVPIEGFSTFKHMQDYVALNQDKYILFRGEFKQLPAGVSFPMLAQKVVLANASPPGIAQQANGKTSRLVWAFGKYTGLITSDDINFLKRIPEAATFELVRLDEILQWNIGSPFTAYIEHLTAEKTRCDQEIARIRDNPPSLESHARIKFLTVKRNLIKLLANGFYGLFGINVIGSIGYRLSNRDEASIKIENSNNVLKVMQGTTQALYEIEGVIDTSVRQIYIAHATAHKGQLYILEVLIRAQMANMTILYCDTDSLIAYGKKGVFDSHVRNAIDKYSVDRGVLGGLTDEIPEGGRIVLYCCLGLKAYGYIVEQGTVLKENIKYKGWSRSWKFAERTVTENRNYARTIYFRYNYSAEYFRRKNIASYSLTFSDFLALAVGKIDEIYTEFYNFRFGRRMFTDENAMVQRDLQSKTFSRAYLKGTVANDGEIKPLWLT